MLLLAIRYYMIYDQARISPNFSRKLSDVHVFFHYSNCATISAAAELLFLFGVVQWRHWGTAPGDTLQGVTPEGKKIVCKFTKNSGETSSYR